MVGPGHRAVTVTPRRRVSCRSAWLKDSTKAFARHRWPGRGGLEGDGGRDVQPDQGGDVNADDVHLSCSVGSVEVRSVEGAVGSEADVVDQQIDGPVTEFTQQRQDAVAGGQVGGEEGDHAVSGISDDALADLFKPIRVPAGEQEVEAALTRLGGDGAQPEEAPITTATGPGIPGEDTSPLLRSGRPWRGRFPLRVGCRVT